MRQGSNNKSFSILLGMAIGLSVFPIDCIEAQGPMSHEASVAMHVYRGVVQSSAGLPIPQAHVRVQASSKLLVTNELGAFEMQSALDSVDVEVSATGFVPKTIRLAADLPKVFIGLEEAIHDLAAAEVSSQMGATGRPSQKQVERLTVGALDQIPATSRIEALASLPGVDMVTAGFGSMRPMIRGLSGLRVATLFNGARVESQAWGEYHGIYIPEEGVRAVEVIRGPASLAYGSDAYGGVLNFVPVAPLSEQGRQSRLALNAYSATGGWQVTGATEKRSKSAFHAFRGGFKQHGDYALPSGNTVENSAYQQFFAQGSYGYIRNWGIVEGAYSSAYSNADIIGHEGWQQSGDHFLTTSVRTQWGEWNLIPRISYQLNHRKEFEHHHGDGAIEVEAPEELALDISLRTLRWDVSMDRTWGGGWSVAAGIQGFKMSSEFDEEVGVELIHEALIPNAGADENSLYAVWSKKAEQWGIQAAGRTDVRTTHSSEWIDAWNGQQRTDALHGFSAGGHWSLSDRLTWNAHVAQSQRVPGLSELLSSGIHHCAFRFEQGDVELQKETSFNVETNLRWHGRLLNFEGSLYQNAIENYVLIAPTWQVEQGYTLFQWQATDALFRGGEVAASLNETNVEHWMAQVAWSWVEASDSDGQALPLIPPMSTRAMLGYRWGSWHSRAILQHSVDATLVHCSIGGTLANQLDLTCSVHNLLNVGYLPTLSMLRNLGISEPGRNVRIQLAWTF